MLGRDVTPDHVGMTVVIGEGTKRKRGVIRQVFNASTYTRILYEANGKRAIVLPLDDEIDLEP